MRSYVMAALCAAGLALAASGAVAAPIAPLGKAADAVDSRSAAHYYYTTIIGIITVTITIIVTAGGGTAIVTAVGRAGVKSVCI